MPEQISSLTPQGIRLLQQQSDIKQQEHQRKEAAAFLKIKQQQNDMELERTKQQGIQFQEQSRQQEMDRQTRVLEGEKDRTQVQEQAEAGRGFAREQGVEQRAHDQAMNTQRMEQDKEVVEHQAGLLKEENDRVYERQRDLNEQDNLDQAQREKLEVKANIEQDNMLLEMNAAVIANLDDEKERRRLTTQAMDDLSKQVETGNLYEQEMTEVGNAVAERIAGGAGSELSGLFTKTTGSGGLLDRLPVDAAGSPLDLMDIYNAAKREMGKVPGDPIVMGPQGRSIKSGSADTYPEDDPYEINVRAYQKAKAEYEAVAENTNYTSPIIARASRGRGSIGSVVGSLNEIRSAEPRPPSEAAVLFVAAFASDLLAGVPQGKAAHLEAAVPILGKILKYQIEGGEGKNEEIHKMISESGNASSVFLLARLLSKATKGMSEGTMEIGRADEQDPKTNRAVKNALRELDRTVFSKLTTSASQASPAIVAPDRQKEMLKTWKRISREDMTPEDYDVMIDSLSPGQQDIIDQLERAKTHAEGGETAVTRAKAQQLKYNLSVRKGELDQLDLIEKQTRERQAQRAAEKGGGG